MHLHRAGFPSRLISQGQVYPKVWSFPFISQCIPCPSSLTRFGPTRTHSPPPIMFIARLTTIAPTTCSRAGLFLGPDRRRIQLPLSLCSTFRSSPLIPHPRSFHPSFTTTIPPSTTYVVTASSITLSNTHLFPSIFTHIARSCPMLFRSLERGCFVVSFFSVRSSGSFQRYEVMYIMPSFTFRIVVCC